MIDTIGWVVVALGCLAYLSAGNKDWFNAPRPSLLFIVLALPLLRALMYVNMFSVLLLLKLVWWHEPWGVSLMFKLPLLLILVAYSYCVQGALLGLGPLIIGVTKLRAQYRF